MKKIKLLISIAILAVTTGAIAAPLNTSLVSFQLVYQGARNSNMGGGVNYLGTHYASGQVTASGVSVQIASGNLGPQDTAPGYTKESGPISLVTLGPQNPPTGDITLSFPGSFYATTVKRKVDFAKPMSFPAMPIQQISWKGLPTFAITPGTYTISDMGPYDLSCSITVYSVGEKKEDCNSTQSQCLVVTCGPGKS